MTGKVIIVGAGAAGMLAAIFAARAGADVILLERGGEPGRKLLVTGGGHCNLTNVLPPEELIARFGKQGRFMRDALKALDNNSLREFFRTIGVDSCVTDGFHVFPVSNSARQVRDALHDELRRLGVQVRAGCRADSLCIEGGKICGLVCGAKTISAGKVILACGGKSYPKTGSDGSGFALAESAGHTVTPLYPALAGLHTEQSWPGEISGVVVQDTEVWADLKKRRKRKFRGPLLFTHKGISGPPVLDLSGDVAEALEREKELNLCINFFPEENLADWETRFAKWRKSSGSKKIITCLAEYLPRSLIECLCSESALEPDTVCASLPGKGAKLLAENLVGLKLKISRTAGFATAIITRGGVSLKEVDPRNMQSRIISGLNFAGEMLDLDGPCGGYNLQWAFSSGALAGTS